MKNPSPRSDTQQHWLPDRQDLPRFLETLSFLGLLRYHSWKLNHTWIIKLCSHHRCRCPEHLLQPSCSSAAESTSSKPRNGQALPSLKMLMLKYFGWE